MAACPERLGNIPSQGADIGSFADGCLEGKKLFILVIGKEFETFNGDRNGRKVDLAAFPCDVIGSPSVDSFGGIGGRDLAFSLRQRGAGPLNVVDIDIRDGKRADGCARLVQGVCFLSEGQGGTICLLSVIEKREHLGRFTDGEDEKPCRERIQGTEMADASGLEDPLGNPVDVRGGHAFLLVDEKEAERRIFGHFVHENSIMLNAMDNSNQLRKRLLAALRKADYDYGLISDGDRILVGLSGGKDSLALLDLLSVYRKFPGKNFALTAIHLDFGFPAVDFSPVEEYVHALGIDYIPYEAKEVYGILDENRNPKTGLLPCSICSRMRKAIVNKAANRLGFSKVAFAHHMDDAIETLFLNMAYGGRIATFEPKMFLENAKIEFIRPLIYVREQQISRYVKAMGLPIAKNSCGNDKKTQREFMKAFLSSLYGKIPDAHNNFASMLSNSDSFQLFFERFGAHPASGIEVKHCVTAKDMLDVAKVGKKTDTPDDFDGGQAIYYLLRCQGEPKAYLKAWEKEDFSVSIRYFEKVEDVPEKSLFHLLDVFEKNLSMRHVPREISYLGERNADVFASFGYHRDGDKLVKTITKALKI